MGVHVQGSRGRRHLETQNVSSVRADLATLNTVVFLTIQCMESKAARGPYPPSQGSRNLDEVSLGNVQKWGKVTSYRQHSLLESICRGWNAGRACELTSPIQRVSDIKPHVYSDRQGKRSKHTS